MTYDPPVNDPAELKGEHQTHPTARTSSSAGSSRRRRGVCLANLANIPAVVITTEASYHAAYDHCTAKYLAQAGVKVTALRPGAPTASTATGTWSCRKRTISKLPR